MTAKVFIKSEREKPVINKHPWIFSGAIAEVSGNPEPGDIVTVVSSTDRFLGRGYWNLRSQIQVRLLTWEDEPIDRQWWEQMLHRAIEGRKGLSSCRLVNAENDFLPGLIVDRYGDWLVLQALTLGIEKQKSTIVEILSNLVSCEGIYERSDVDVRKKEGLQTVTGLMWGKEPPENIEILEDDLRLLVDVRHGHKTGFYLDQRENRFLVRQILGDRSDARVLNLFSYTGGFGFHALRAKAAQVLNVDSSLEVLKLAETISQINGFSEECTDLIQANVFEFLRYCAEEGTQFDLVICDPPKFAHNAGQVERAARGYKDLNLNAFKVVKPGGYLMTFSCSGGISADLFQKIVFGALADSGRQAQILRHLEQSCDHPVALSFPEGAYLKGLLLRVY